MPELERDPDRPIGGEGGAGCLAAGGRIRRARERSRLPRVRACNFTASATLVFATVRVLLYREENNDNVRACSDKSCLTVRH